MRALSILFRAGSARCPKRAGLLAEVGPTSPESIDGVRWLVTLHYGLTYRLLGNAPEQDGHRTDHPLSHVRPADAGTRVPATPGCDIRHELAMVDVVLHT